MRKIVKKFCVTFRPRKYKFDLQAFLNLKFLNLQTWSHTNALYNRNKIALSGKRFRKSYSNVFSAFFDLTVIENLRIRCSFFYALFLFVD